MNILNRNIKIANFFFVIEDELGSSHEKKKPQYAPKLN